MTKISDIELKKMEQSPELGEVITCLCNFCEKIQHLYQSDYDICCNLGHGRFHCPFCIRHNHHQGNSRHVLMLTFKPLIGYYYYTLYQQREMYLTQIESYIKDHVAAGLFNPAFSYDPENYNWYIDFTKVGNTPHKMTVETVIGTIDEIVGSFCLKERIPHANVKGYLDKFEEAIRTFYEQRQRPIGKKLLEPTLVGCGYFAHNFNHDLMKNISPNFFFDSSLTQTSSNTIKGLRIDNRCDKEKGKQNMSKLVVNVREGKAGWTGSVAISGLSSTKLARKDGETTFPSRSALTTVARNVGKRLGLEVEYAEQAKKAAKKAPTAKAKASKTAATTPSTCTQTPSA